MVGENSAIIHREKIDRSINKFYRHCEQGEKLRCPIHRTAFTDLNDKVSGYENFQYVVLFELSLNERYSIVPKDCATLCSTFSSLLHSKSLAN